MKHGDHWCPPYIEISVHEMYDNIQSQCREGASDINDHGKNFISSNPFCTFCVLRVIRSIEFWLAWEVISRYLKTNKVVHSLCNMELKLTNAMTSSAYSNLSKNLRANHLHALTFQVYNRIKRNYRWPSDLWRTDEFKSYFEFRSSSKFNARIRMTNSACLLASYFGLGPAWTI